jgi:hypothetical protein
VNLQTLLGLAECFLLAQTALAAPPASMETPGTVANPFAIISESHIFH